MIKKTAVYTDFNGNERTEDCYFHFSEPELLDLETSVEGGFFTKTVTDIINAKDGLKLSILMKDLMLKAYGVKSPDGKRFIKSEEISKEFSQTEAFSTLFMEFITDDKAAADFVNMLVPKSLEKLVKEKESAALSDSIK
jgi:hypothetical protein